jgi:hypothetical protein
MTMIAIYWANEPNEDDGSFHQRIAYGCPVVGEFVWMDPDTGNRDWQVATTHLFQPPAGSKFDDSVVLAEVAQRAGAKPDFHGRIELYFLDGKYFTFSLSGGYSELETGSFEEYEPITCAPLPITKRITDWQELIGDGCCKVAIALLEAIPNSELKSESKELSAV